MCAWPPWNRTSGRGRQRFLWSCQIQHSAAPLCQRTAGKKSGPQESTSGSLRQHQQALRKQRRLVRIESRVPRSMANPVIPNFGLPALAAGDRQAVNVDKDGGPRPPSLLRLDDHTLSQIDQVASGSRSCEYTPT